jgi:hypothetical protein
MVALPHANAAVMVARREITVHRAFQSHSSPDPPPSYSTKAIRRVPSSSIFAAISKAVITRPLRPQTGDVPFGAIIVADQWRRLQSGGGGGKGQG